MPAIARLGDTSTHGGHITTASLQMAEGARIACAGDTLDCPQHGPNPIVGHSMRMKCEGRWVARHGDATACGASLIASAAKAMDT